MRRFAAKLLFQFRVQKGRGSNRRRVCEERIISIQARSEKVALRLAKRTGEAEQLSYPDGVKTVFLEFVGVLQLIELDNSKPEEVWWEFVERLNPWERRKKLVPPENKLAAFRSKPPKYSGRIRV